MVRKAIMVVFTGDKNEWNDIISKFDFYNMYQTYEWGEHKKQTGWRVVRLVLGHRDNPRFAAQVLVKKLPLRIGFCWIPGGLLGESTSDEIKAILKEVGIKFFVLRSSFNYYDDKVKLNLISNSWKESIVKINSGLTFIKQIGGDPANLQEKMSKNWRHNLRRSGKKNIIFEELKDVSADLIRSFYSEMEELKGIKEQFSKEDIQSMLDNLNRNKLKFFVARNEDGEVLAFRAYYSFRNKCWDLFAVTKNKGRKLYASHGLLSYMMEDMINNQITFFDLSGADPINNKGNYNFKKGAGAELYEYLGEWDLANTPFLRLLFNLLLKLKGF
jgi:lipid II:glycine glycyltransferase (peptidoglycan interpeptide bridge formation enzyme)